MPYNELINARIQKIVSNWENTNFKKMFGGICHLLNGNMVCGVYKDFLILRLGEKDANIALQSAEVKPFDITGRPMKGWIMVSEKGISNDEQLKHWLEQAKKFVLTLPTK